MDSYSSFLGLNLVMLAPVSLLMLAMPFVPTKYRTRPTKPTMRNNNHALKQGWPLIVVRIMQTTQHLTVWTQHMTVTYLLLAVLAHVMGDSWGWSCLSDLRCMIRAILPGAGGVVAQFWSIALIFGPWAIIDREDIHPKDDKKANQVAQRLLFRPSLTPMCGILLLMHLQHTWMPLIPWVESYFFGHLDALQSCPLPSAWTQLGLTVAYLLAWQTWCLVVWHARMNPPYPILRTGWQSGRWPLLYVAASAIVVLAVNIFQDWGPGILVKEA